MLFLWTAVYSCHWDDCICLTKGEIMYKGYLVKNCNEIIKYEPSSAPSTEFKERQEKFDSYVNSLVNERQTVLDGNRLENIFFPLENFDFFISHSSRDWELAQYVKMMLSSNHERTSFIDSDIWLHVDLMINNLATKLAPGNKNLLLTIAANANVMLAASLIRMLDRCKYFLFLETPGALAEWRGNSRTFSPWIMLELVASKIMPTQAVMEGAGMEAHYINFAYSVDLDHLEKLSAHRFKEILDSSGRWPE